MSASAPAAPGATKAIVFFLRLVFPFSFVAVAASAVVAVAPLLLLVLSTNSNERRHRAGECKGKGRAATSASAAASAALAAAAKALLAFLALGEEVSSFSSRAAPICPCLFLRSTAAAPAGKNLPPAVALIPFDDATPIVAAAALSAAAASLSALALSAASCLSSKVIPRAETIDSENLLIFGANEGGKGVTCGLEWREGET